LQAARQLGWKEIAVVFVDDDEPTSRAYAAADNRLGSLGGYDLDALQELLAGVELQGTGFTADDLADLAGDVNPADFVIDVAGMDDLDDLDDLDDVPVVSDAGTGGQALDVRTLKWAGSEATLTFDEAESLTRLLDQYRAEYSTDLGFGWYLINNRLKP
jgi:ParB-like chromosome segregation protein Spo0J